MEPKGKRASGGRVNKAALPKTAEEYLERTAEEFAIFLVGKTIEVVDHGPEVPLRVTGIVRQQENSVLEEHVKEQAKNFLEEPPAKEVADSSWQVSIMSAEMHREYTYCVLDFVYEDDRPYQTQQRAMQVDNGFEYFEKKCTMTIKDTEDKQKEAVQMHKERHFLGGCADGLDIIKGSGVGKLKDQRVFAWWPGERAWYEGTIVSTNSKSRGFAIHFDDGDEWDVRPHAHMVWRLESTKDTIENGQAALNRKADSKASDAKAKSAAKSAEGNAKKKSSSVSKSGKDSKKRKASGLKEHNPSSAVIDIGHLIVTRDGDNMRYVDEALPRMSKKNKSCKVERPGPECAIFTIDEGGKKQKHIVNVVATTHDVVAADMDVQGDIWQLDWTLKPKA